MNSASPSNATQGSVLAPLFDLIHTNDFGALIIVIAVLSWLGSFAMRNEEGLRRIATRMTFGVFVAYLVGQIWFLGAQMPGLIVIRIVRAAIAASLTFAVASLALPIGLNTWQICSQPMYRLAKHYWYWIDTKRRRECELEQQRQEQFDVMLRERTAELEARFAHENELETAKRQAAEREKRDRKRHARDGILFHCRLFYDGLDETLRKEFTTETLQTYFDTFMGADLPIEHIEERAEHLLAMLSKKSGGTNSNSGAASVAELIQQFEEQRIAIRDSTMDDNRKESLLAELAMEHDRALRAFREKAP